MVQLILAQGSRAGTKAPIQDGFYMIGRHAECQIRPKSRSVSRRHCLVHRQGDEVRVLDLGSTSGTTVNDESLEPMQWQAIVDGDQIRCGKVAFNVALHDAESSAVAESSPPSEASVVQGEAWEDFDIASFLETQDDADREKRYDEIRKRAEESDDNETDLDETDSDEESHAAASRNRDGSVARPTPAQKRRFKKLPSRGGSGIFGSLVGREDQLKLIGAVIVALGVIGFFVYQVVQFQSGPPVRVIKEID